MKNRAGPIIAATVIALVILWCFPLAGFHHQYLVGLFGWLAINGEDPDPRSWLYFAGEEYLPNPIGLVPTFIATWIVLRFAWWKILKRSSHCS